MRALFAILTGLCLAVAFWGQIGCDDGDRRSSDADADTDGDSDSDTGAAITGAMQGVALAPSGAFPIPGALIYLTKGDGPDIPDSIFCYDCEDMTEKKWTLSNADGTWSLTDVPVGDWNIVVRKGFFQRQRDVSVSEGQVLDVPAEKTTLPSDNSDDGLDQIPNYAVLGTYPDETYNLLGKIGMGTMAGGEISWGSETFDIFDDNISASGYPSPATLFADQTTLDHYHMIFLPCSADSVGLGFVDGHLDMIKNYVTGGGKIYNSCCVAYWIEKPFPDYLDFAPNSSDDGAYAWDIGRISGSPLATTGTVVDQGLRDWMQVVTSVSVDAVPFVNGYARVDALIEVDDGHGLDDDNGVVKPYEWVTGAAGDVYQDASLMTTYNYDCGKIFFSVYETSENTAVITPQEFVLIYIILEVGVCEGDYTPPE